MAWNQRQYARCPISADQSAELVIGHRVIKCRLLEMSLASFAVVIPAGLPEHRDSMIRLRVDGLTYIVRVTRQEVQRDGTLVALEQIEEIVPGNTFIPATRLGRLLTVIAWTAAVCIVMVAVYCVSGPHAGSSLSFTL